MGGVLPAVTCGTPGGSQSGFRDESLRSARYQATRNGQKQIESPIGMANQLQNMSIVMAG